MGPWSDSPEGSREPTHPLMPVSVCFLFHPNKPYTNHTLPLVRPVNPAVRSVNPAVGRVLPLRSVLDRCEQKICTIIYNNINTLSLSTYQLRITVLQDSGYSSLHQSPFRLQSPSCANCQRWMAFAAHFFLRTYNRIVALNRQHSPLVDC